jgi:hypothetical protein
MIMNTITTTLATVAMFSDDGKKRYLLRKLWDEKLPSLAVIMLAPSEASGIELDTTTQLVLNNASRLGYGSVTIVNLFATLNDFKLQQAEDEDAENLKEILLAAKNANQVVYAPGVGKAKNKAFALRQEQVLNALRPYEVKLCCLCNESGDARLQHPLSPAVRVWHLSAFKISELLPNPAKEERPTKKKSKKILKEA